jgi:hypothetical protein
VDKKIASPSIVRGCFGDFSLQFFILAPRHYRFLKAVNVRILYAKLSILRVHAYLSGSSDLFAEAYCPQL